MDTAKVSQLPKCNFCDDSALYDGMTVYGPWAYMCQGCFDLHGIGTLGLGKGQRLEVIA